MLISMKQILGYKLESGKEEIGKVVDSYINDLNWTVDYVMAHEGPKWLGFGRQLVISPHYLREPDNEEKTVHVKLHANDLKAIPGITTELPESLKENLDINKYHAFATNWEVDGAVIFDPEPVKPTMGTRMSPTLRSIKHFIGFKVEAIDGRIGDVEDLIVDTDGYRVRYIVNSTGNWLTGHKKVLIATDWIQSVDWVDKTMKVNLSKDQIQLAPKYQPSKSIVNMNYEESLFQHYKETPYWRKETRIY